MVDFEPKQSVRLRIATRIKRNREYKGRLLPGMVPGSPISEFHMGNPGLIRSMFVMRRTQLWLLVICFLLLFDYAVFCYADVDQPESTPSAMGVEICKKLMKEDFYKNLVDFQECERIISSPPVILEIEPEKNVSESKSRIAVGSRKPASGEYLEAKFNDGSTIWFGVPDSSFRMETVMQMNEGRFGGLVNTWQDVGAENVFVGRVNFAQYDFWPDVSYPLSFIFVTNGFFYLSGKGVVTSKTGETFRFGDNDNLLFWIIRSNHPRSEIRQGSAQAISYLARTNKEKIQCLPIILRLMKDPSWRVRRDAVASIIRLKPKTIKPNIIQALSSLAAKDDNEWVKKIAKDAMALLNPGKN